MACLAMKANESADCAGRWGGRLPTGLCFFFLGPRNRKMNFKKLGFRRGSDFSMLRSSLRINYSYRTSATDLRLCWHSRFYMLGKRFKCFFVRRGPCRPELAKYTKVRVCQVKLILSPKQRAKPAASRTRTCTNTAVCIASGECPSRF